MNYPAGQRPEGRGWQAIAAACTEAAAHGGLFTIRDMMRCVAASRDTINDALRRMVKGGYIVRLGRLPYDDKGATLAVYRIKRDLANFDGLRYDGKASRPQTAKATTRMWNAMRLGDDFDVTSLAALASLEGAPIARATARAYITRLHQASYLRCVQEGGANRLARYRLIHNTGPQAPQVRRDKTIFEPNDDTR